MNGSIGVDGYKSIQPQQVNKCWLRDLEPIDTILHFTVFHQFEYLMHFIWICVGN